MVASIHLFELESINFDQNPRKSHSAVWTLRKGGFRKALHDDHNRLLQTNLSVTKIDSEVIQMRKIKIPDTLVMNSNII